MKTKCMSCGGTIKKMQNGGPVNKNKFLLKEAQNGKKIMQNSGLLAEDSGIIKRGRPITEKAAARKVAKGKGAMSYKYGNTDAPGTGNNKGVYTKYAKDQKSAPYGSKNLSSKSRPVMQKGGIAKKK